MACRGAGGRSRPLLAGIVLAFLLLACGIARLEAAHGHRVELGGWCGASQDKLGVPLLSDSVEHGSGFPHPPRSAAEEAGPRFEDARGVASAPEVLEAVP